MLKEEYQANVEALGKDASGCKVYRLGNQRYRFPYGVNPQYIATTGNCRFTYRIGENVFYSQTRSVAKLVETYQRVIDRLESEGIETYNEEYYKTKNPRQTRKRNYNSRESDLSRKLLAQVVVPCGVYITVNGNIHYIRYRSPTGHKSYATLDNPTVTELQKALDVAQIKRLIEIEFHNQSVLQPYTAFREALNP